MAISGRKKTSEPSAIVRDIAAARLSNAAIEWASTEETLDEETKECSFEELALAALGYTDAVRGSAK